MTYTIDYAIISGKWGDIMSYETDVMRNLTLALRENNKNIEVLKYLSLELRRANELKEIELGLRKVEDYSFNQNNQKKKIKRDAESNGIILGTTKTDTSCKAV